MRAAINLVANLYAVAQDGAIALGAPRGERMRRAFETIEHMRLAVFCHSKCFVVIVAAGLALSHRNASTINRWWKDGWPYASEAPRGGGSRARIRAANWQEL
jgi:hypothetical protein